MPFNPQYGTLRIKEEGYHKKNSPCGCGHDLSMPYGNCVLCAELDSSGNIIMRQLPYVTWYANDTQDAYYETSMFDSWSTSYRNPLDYTYPSKGQTGPMFLKVRIEGATSNSDSFYSTADEINGEYTTIRLPYYSTVGSVRDDTYCAWYGYPCNKDKVYSSAGFNKIEVYFSSGVTNWFPTESFPPDAQNGLYGTTSGIMDLYLNCRLSFAKYDHSFGASTNRICGESYYLSAIKKNSIIEKRVKVGTIVRWQQLLSDKFQNSDVRCNDWSNLELTDFNIPSQPYPTGAYSTIDGAWADGYPMDEDMFESSGLRVFVTSLTNESEKFNEFIHHSNGGEFNVSPNWPYYPYGYDCGFGATCTGYVFADTNTEIMEHGIAFGVSQEPHFLSETLRDVYRTNPMPFAYKVTVSNLQNKNCTACTGLNGEHVLHLYGQDNYSRHENDYGTLFDKALYGKHFYNKEVPYPSSMGYSGPLPCIYGIRCSGVIAENFGLDFVPQVSGGHIDFSIGNTKHGIKVRYRRTVLDEVLHNSFSYNGSFTPTIENIDGFVAAPQPGSGVVSNMCEWSSANIKVEPYFNISQYTTNCFAPCLTCYSCKDGIMPSSITVTIGDFEYTHNNTVKNAAGTYTLQKSFEPNTTHGVYSTSYSNASNAIDVARGLWIDFIFGCAGGDNKIRITVGGGSIGSDCGDNGNNGTFYYNIPASSLGTYYSPLYYSGGFWSSDTYYPNVDFFDCTNVDGYAVFSNRLHSSCTQSGPTVYVTFNP